MGGSYNKLIYCEVLSLPSREACKQRWDTHTEQAEEEQGWWAGDSGHVRVTCTAPSWPLTGRQPSPPERGHPASCCKWLVQACNQVAASPAS